ncbi:MAG: transcriptional repressor NrdR [Deltaproteobacteria bacterium]|nr:transcriptional repressor NrdR [Deltaproteobacteria bacterium]MBW2071824.1 transcriptional repressor NrdR [Deltaproteobacteria bacterium]
MKCPYCDHLKTRVIDSRPGNGSNHTRRRRLCDSCGRRFTTFERFDDNKPLVIKKDGRLEVFDRSKLLEGLRKACAKLPVPEGDLSRIAGEIETKLQSSRRRKFRSKTLGDWAAAALRHTHPVAYIRYSMVHRRVEDLQGIQALLSKGVEPSR